MNLLELFCHVDDLCQMHASVRVPGLHGGGWFDHLTRGQFDAYRNIRDRGSTKAAREGQRLLIGPWGHKTIGNTGPDHCRYGAWNFAAEADLSVLAHEVQFLDFHLRDVDNGFVSQAPAKVFLMGENRWLSLKDWPPPEAVEQVWHLDSGGSANMRTGDGKLTLAVPSHSAADAYTYDPQRPVPTLGGPIYWGLEPRGLWTSARCWSDRTYYIIAALSWMHLCPWWVRLDWICACPAVRWIRILSPSCALKKRPVR